MCGRWVRLDAGYGSLIICSNSKFGKPNILIGIKDKRVEAAY